MHEFEALLFSDTERFALHPDWTAQARAALSDIRRGFASPEDIDDGPNTAPTARLDRIFPGYARHKLLYGPPIARDIGIQTMRAECSGFDAWLTRMEAAAAG